MKLLSGIVIAVLLAASLWWSHDADNPPDPATLPPGVLQAYMKNVHMLAMDETGQAALEMTARSMKQYSDREQAELEQPQITLRNPSQQWHIASAQGLIDRDRQTVSLHNRVVLKQQSGDPPRTLEIHARSLQLDIDRQLARSDEAVTLLTGNSKLKARGMVLDNRNGRLQLLADVHGFHDAR